MVLTHFFLGSQDTWCHDIRGEGVWFLIAIHSSWCLLWSPLSPQFPSDSLHWPLLSPSDSSVGPSRYRSASCFHLSLRPGQSILLSFGHLYMFYNTKYIYLVFVPGSLTCKFLKPWELTIGMSLKKLKHYLFILLAALGLGCCSQAFSNCVWGRRGRYSLLQCENLLWWLLLWRMNCKAWASVIVGTSFLSHSIWDPQVWTVSPAFAGRLPITGPPGESNNVFCYS